MVAKNLLDIAPFYVKQRPNGVPRNGFMPISWNFTFAGQGEETVGGLLHQPVDQK